MTEPAVVFDAVTKRYGQVVAVDAVSFGIEAGTLVTLLGPSGCGKTTTLRLVAGLEQPSEGRIRIGGRDVTWLTAADRDVSMVFQSYALFPHMSVLDNICYGLRASGLKPREAEARAAEKIALVGLSGMEKRFPSELSGGQQQRVAVARAIVLEPRVLLFDEPLSNLDARLRRRVREEIRALQQQLSLTVVYVTHDQEEALAVSDRIVVMNHARIAQDGPPRALYEAPANRFVAEFIGSANLLPARVLAVNEGAARVRVGKLTLDLPTRQAAPGDALLALRPHGAVLSRTGDAGLDATVRRATYLGDRMEYELELADPAATVLATDADLHAPLAPGAAVRLVLRAEACSLVPGD